MTDHTQSKHKKGRITRTLRILEKSTRLTEDEKRRQAGKDKKAGGLFKALRIIHRGSKK